MGIREPPQSPRERRADLQSADHISCVSLDETIANKKVSEAQFSSIYIHGTHTHGHTYTESLNWCPLLPSLLFTQPPTPSHTHLLVQRQANLAHCLFASSRFIPSTPSGLKPPPTPYLAFLITSLFPHQTFKRPCEEHRTFIISEEKNSTFFRCGTGKIILVIKYWFWIGVAYLFAQAW